MNTQEVCQCPICFDTISDKKNNITTECGHKFHASCLMTNVSRNGFDCPCCRAVMATPEYPEYPEEQEYHSDSDSSTFHSQSDYDSYSDCDSFEFESDTDEECEIPISTIPTVDYMTIEYMIHQFVESGITIKHLIGAIVVAVISSDVKYQIDMDIRDTYNNIWYQIDAIIENYKNHQEIINVSPVVEEEPVRETIHPSIVIAKNIKKYFRSVDHLDQILEDLQLKMDFTDLNQIRKDLQLNYPSH